MSDEIKKDVKLSDYDVAFMRLAVLIGVALLIAALVLEVISIVRLEVVMDGMGHLDSRFRVIENIVLERQREIQKKEAQ